MSFSQLSDLDGLLAAIDAAQLRVNALKEAHPDAFETLREGWAVESTYNSNTIEGSTLSLGDTTLVYRGERVEAPEDDIRQAEGGFAALRFLDAALADDEALSERLIRRAHELLFAEAKDPATRGAYRTSEVEITGTTFEPAPAQFVPERMCELVSVCTRSRRHPVLVAALFHLEFESIHPFVNANGRTGRLISNFILLRAGYEPVNIQAVSRARYIRTLRAFQLDDDPFPFAQFFCENLLERQRRIEAMLTGSANAAGRPEASGVTRFLADEDVSLSRETTDPSRNTDETIMALMERQPAISAAEIGRNLGMSSRQVERRIKTLRERGAVERIGGTRGTWQVNGLPGPREQR